MGGSLTILWGRGVGPCTGIASKSNLSWWLRVAGGSLVGNMEKLVILRGCKWDGDLISSFPRIFGGALVGGGHLY